MKEFEETLKDTIKLFTDKMLDSIGVPDVLLKKEFENNFITNQYEDDILIIGYLDTIYTFIKLIGNKFIRKESTTYDGIYALVGPITAYIILWDTNTTYVYKLSTAKYLSIQYQYVLSEPLFEYPMEHK
jgi:hypothetical protein